MPGATTDRFSITTSTSPGRSCGTIVLGGELDLAARAQLDHAVRQLTRTRPATVVVDLAAVTFVGADLPNLLLKLRHGLPPGTVLVVTRPSPRTAWVLQLTGMTDVVDRYCVAA